MFEYVNTFQSKIPGLIEKWAPLIVAFACFIFGLMFSLEKGLVLGPEFDNILNAVITFASISVGFLGVLLGVLFSMNSESVKKFLAIDRAKRLTKKYFVSALLSGTAVVVLGMLLFVRENFSTPIKAFDEAGIIVLSWKELVFCLWLSVTVYLFLTTYRIINAMMQILFNHNEKDEEIKSVTSRKISSDVEELEKKYRNV